MRYFFDTHDGQDLTSDDHGVELPNLKAARDAAIAELPELARDVLPNGDQHDMSVSVRDQSGRAVFRAKLALSSEWL